MSSTSPLAREVGAAAGAIARRMLDDPLGPIEAATTPGRAQAELERAVAREVAPIVAHVANAEPWYQSRVTWGALVASASPVAGLLLGTAVSAEQQAFAVQVATAIGTLVGAAITLYGRWIAKRPLGT